jgi:hypothetical protein
MNSRATHWIAKCAQFQFRSQTFYAAKNSAASRQQEIIVQNNCVLAQNGLFSFNNGINSYRRVILYEKNMCDYITTSICSCPKSVEIQKFQVLV